MYTRYASGQEGGRKRSWTLTPLGGASVQGLGGSAPGRGQDAVPEAGAGGERDVHGLRTLAPLGVVVTAQVGEHLHGHRRVLLAIHLDVPCQIVDERVQRRDFVVDRDHLLEHVRDQVLATERERGRLAVHPTVVDEPPRGRRELGGRCRYPGGDHRLRYRPAGAQLADQPVDRGGVRAGLTHAVDVQLEVADEAAAQLVALLDEHDVVDEPPAAR